MDVPTLALSLLVGALTLARAIKDRCAAYHVEVVPADILPHITLWAAGRGREIIATELPCRKATEPIPTLAFQTDRHPIQGEPFARGDSDMRDERVGAGQIGLGLLWQSPSFCGESCL
jgi:hypothetical protein